jgi:hypothetical protein
MLPTVKTRIQVSIHPDLVQIAEDNMAVRKYSSFSAYLEMLIREEYARGLATENPTPVNSSASPAFQAIFDAGVAAARAGQSAAPAPVQPVNYSNPAQKGRKLPKKPLKK